MTVKPRVPPPVQFRVLTSQVYKPLKCEDNKSVGKTGLGFITRFEFDWLLFRVKNFFNEGLPHGALLHEVREKIQAFINMKID